VTGLRTAWIFLTRVPLGDDPHPDVARAVPWFPVVGAIVGLVSAAAWWLGTELLTPLPAAALTISVAALVTGAFHHDGLADMADGFGGGWDRDQRLVIMKDSRHGTYGVMALVGVVAIQVGALASLGPAQGAAALVAAHSLGRAGAVVMLRTVPVAREDGLGVDWSSRVRPSAAAVGVAAGVVAAGAALGWVVVIAVAAVAVVVAACAVLAVRKIGGFTGDVLGAAEQLGETATLLVTAALVRHEVTFPWWR
jgi:adenosylcobinamide-GDP ribazoletransferase